jgi:cytochrome P450
MLHQWVERAGQPFDVCPPLMQMTFKVITRSISNAEIPGDMDELTDSLTIIMREGERVLWALFPFLQSLPGPRHSRLKKALKVFDDCMYELIRERLESGKPQGDLLDMLLAQKNPQTGEMVSMRELRDDLMTILIAGHETTAMAIAWSCAMISRNPILRHMLRAEVDAVLGGRLPTLADLPKLEFTGMIVEEALRLYPPFWSISRKALADDALGDYRIPAGSTLMLCPYVTHRNPRYWKNPEAFDPQRFSAAEREARPKYAYYPFGGGPRVCLGKAFALMEAKLYLAMLTQRMALDLVLGQQLDAEPMISLRPKGGIHMVGDLLP